MSSNVIRVPQSTRRQSVEDALYEGGQAQLSPPFSEMQETVGSLGLSQPAELLWGLLGVLLVAVLSARPPGVPCASKALVPSLEGNDAGPLFSFRSGVESILPPNAHELAHQRLHVSITNTRTRQNHLVSSFPSREDLIKVTATFPVRGRQRA